MQSSRKTILSGIQPSNVLHLGNYLGAVRNWLTLQDDYNCYFMMVDLHAITVSQNPEDLRNASYMGLAMYLAAGLDPEKSILFLQSHVPAHSQLAWMLICSSYMGELNRMTQFKDKSKKQDQNIPVGLYVYPSLMAADILMYQADFIPVGDDQRQHIELTRNIAERINNRYDSKIFTMPQPMISENGCRIMDLQEPTNKMSKSAENQKGVVYLNDSDKQITKKFKSAVTDSGSEVVEYEKSSPGIKNLIDIMSALTGKSHTEINQDFIGKQYGFLKVAAAEVVVETLSPIREKTAELLKDKSYLDKILFQGAEKANEAAEKTLKKVQEAFGFVPRRPV